MDKNWWKKKENEFDEFDYFILYQKTLIDEKKINYIINNSKNYFENDRLINIKNNLYFKYQPAIKNYIN